MDNRTDLSETRRANSPSVGISPTEFVRRHVVYRLNSTNGLITQNVASQVDPRTGEARTTQRFIAEDMGKSPETIKRGFRWLCSPESGPVLIKVRNRLYAVAGYLAHDPRTCGNSECAADVRSVGRSDRKRAQERERARRYRARKASERS